MQLLELLQLLEISFTVLAFMNDERYHHKLKNLRLNSVQSDHDVNSISYLVEGTRNHLVINSNQNE